MIHLYLQIEFKKHGTVIDEIEYTGFVSTVIGGVSYSGIKTYNGEVFNSGFKILPHESQNFEAVGKLSDLGLGFFNDITVPIYKVCFELTFIRNIDNNAIFRWKSLKADGTEDPATLPAEGTVTINTFYLRVPAIEYSSEAKTNLINDLFKENYIFQFKKWQYIRHLKVTVKSLAFDITNIYRDVNNPFGHLLFFKQTALITSEKITAHLIMLMLKTCG